MENNGVPKATLGRLPTYLMYLQSIEKEKKNISATTIAKALGFGEVQVRKDLASVSGKGRPRVGYNTSNLITRLESFLGQKNIQQAVIVGAGRLGHALLDYDGFLDFGLDITAAFDSDSKKAGFSDMGKPIYPMSEFEQYCYRNDIKIGVITVPKDSAQAVCDMMIKNNISAIWSFAPIKLKVGNKIYLREENLALSLAHLNKQI